MYHIISLVALIACFIPMLLVLVKKLWTKKSFFLFGLYWTVSGLINCTDFIPGISSRTREIVTVVYNMFDVPIVLTIIYITTKSSRLIRFLRVSIPMYMALLLVNAVINGIRYDAMKYMLAVGLGLVIMTIIWEITRYLKKIEHSTYEKAMLFIHASLLFAYGTFIIIYIFDYYVTTTNKTDNYLIYYISSLIAIGIAICGYLSRGAHGDPNGKTKNKEIDYSEMDFQRGRYL
jgi:hypothetical protein